MKGIFGQLMQELERRMPKEYDKRWLGTEGIISAVKRCFGERVRSKKESNMMKEAKRKFWAYEKIRKYAKA